MKHRTIPGSSKGKQKQATTQKKAKKDLAPMKVESKASSGKGKGKGTAKKVAEQKQPQHTSRSEKAGLIFPVGRVERYARDSIKKQQRVSPKFSVNLACALEYLASELLSISGDHVIANQKKRITPRDMFLAVKADSDFRRLLQGITIPSTGAVEHVDERLLQSKGGKGKKT